MRAVEEIEATLQEIEAIPRVNFRFSEPSQLEAARASAERPAIENIDGLLNTRKTHRSSPGLPR